MRRKTTKTNWVLTLVLILGTVTIFFPLYMALSLIHISEPTRP